MAVAHQNHQHAEEELKKLDELKSVNRYAESTKSLTFLPIVHERQTQRMKTRSEWFLNPTIGSARVDWRFAHLFVCRSAEGDGSASPKPVVRRTSSKEKRLVRRSSSKKEPKDGQSVGQSDANPSLSLYKPRI